jgi:hypothetical protein
LATLIVFLTKTTPRFGGKSPDRDYANMRAYMWAKQMRDWLVRGSIDPEDKNWRLISPGRASNGE